MPFPESTQTNSWAPQCPRVCFPAVPCSGAPGLTYADLIIRLSVADAAEFKLIEGIRELALGGRQICDSRSRENTGVTQGKVPQQQDAGTHMIPARKYPQRDPCKGLLAPGKPQIAALLHPPQDRALWGPCQQPQNTLQEMKPQNSTRATPELRPRAMGQWQMVTHSDTAPQEMAPPAPLREGSSTELYCPPSCRFSPRSGSY